jgi:hypothetical protein
VPPERADLVLSADVPDIEFGVLVGYGFDVEADGGDGCYVLLELEVVEDGCGRDLWSAWPLFADMTTMSM